MRKATIVDRDLVTGILRRSFQDNPSLNAAAGKKKIKHFIQYGFDYSIRRDGVYISDAGDCAAIFFISNERKDDLLDRYYLLRLIINAFPVKNFFNITRHYKYVKAAKPQDKKYIYFWFLGADPGKSSMRNSRSLILDIFNVADNKQLEIFAETTVMQNKIVYERYGFETFKEWYSPYFALTVWFMRRSVKGN